VAAEQKGGQGWVGIALHPRPSVSDIAIFVRKGDIKLQPTCNKERKKVPFLSPSALSKY